MLLAIQRAKWEMPWLLSKLDELTDTQGETVKLKLKWNSFSGEKSAEFDYCTRKATNPQAQEVTAIRCTKKVK